MGSRAGRIEEKIFSVFDKENQWRLRKQQKKKEDAWTSEVQAIRTNPLSEG